MGLHSLKALLKSAETYQAALHADALGIDCGEVSYDFRKIMGRSREVSDQMGGGIEFLFKKNKVDYVVGKGMVHAAGMVEITEGESKGTYLKAEKIMIATGCKPRKVDEVEVDGKRVMTSREALAMTEQPQSIAIMGAGAIGAEFAYFLNAFGTKVTLIEMLPSILPVEDQKFLWPSPNPSMTKGLIAEWRPKWMALRWGRIRFPHSSQRRRVETLEAESLLLAIGVVPNLDGALSDKLSLELTADT